MSICCEINIITRTMQILEGKQEYRTCALSDENGMPTLSIDSQPIHWNYVGESGDVMRVRISCPVGKDAMAIVAAHKDVSWTGTKAEASIRWGLTESDIEKKKPGLLGYN